MTNIDTELIEWAVKRIETEYRDDVALLIGMTGACKTPADEQKLAFDFFVPETERGYRLSETFIIEDMGYDLYPMSFERLEGIADFREPGMMWVLEKSQVIYAAGEEDRRRFEKIREKMHRNLSNPEKTFQKALELLCTAMEIHASMPEEERMGKVRKSAGRICQVLACALDLLNGLASVDGCGNLAEQVEAMEFKPENFSGTFRQILVSSDPMEICGLCGKLIRGVRQLMVERKAVCIREEPDRENINYEDLAFWYQEARYTFRKISYYAGAKDAAVCHSLGCYLQVEFDVVSEEFALKDMDLMGYFDAADLEKFERQAQKLEQELVETIREHGVRINSYDSLEAFLEKHGQL